MKKLIILMIFALALLGLAACRAANDASPAVYQFFGEAQHARNFEMPLTGGGRSLFGGDQRNTAVAQPAAADSAPPPPASAPVPTTVSPEVGQVEWDDIAGQGERHIIQTANVELDAVYFYEVVDKLRQIAPSVNGYISSEMLTAHSRPGRPRFTIVLRVPAASFDTVLRQVEGLADVRSSSQQAQDVTDQFYDMIGSLEIRRLEEDRILALIEEADNVQELLALEQRLSNTRLNIEMYLSQLNNMAGQIAYSTISVTLFDMRDVEEEMLVATLGERIGGAFGDSVGGTVRMVQNVIVFMAGAIIPLTVLGLIAFAVFKIARKIARRRLSA